jgi:CBS domain-containing protein
MQPNDPLINAQALKEAIDRHPLTVTPDTLLVEAIALMSQSRSRSCLLPGLSPAVDAIAKFEARSSCVLVMQDSQLLGIFTERDIVRLTATKMSFEGVKLAEVMAQPIITLNEANFQNIFAALFLFRRYRIRHLPIVSEQGQLVGVVSPESIRQVLRPANLLKLRRVSDVMTKQVVSAPMTVPVMSLAELMAICRVSCVVITEKDEEDRLLPVGIVTERDIVQFQYLELDLSKIQARNAMSTPLFLLNPEDSLWTAHQEMQRRHVRRLVVSWNWGRGLGIVTQTSLLKVFDPMEMYEAIEMLQRTVEQLESEKFMQQNQVQQQEQVQPNRLSPQKLPISLDYSSSKRGSTAQNNLNNLLSSLQVCLESIAKEPDLSSELQQHRLNSALADVEQIRELLQESPNLNTRLLC